MSDLMFGMFTQDIEHEFCHLQEQHCVFFRGAGAGGCDRQAWAELDECVSLAVGHRLSGGVADVVRRMVCRDHHWSTDFEAVAA